MTEQLATSSELSPAAIEERADRLAQQAQQLRLLSNKLQEAQVIAALSKLLAEPDASSDLLSGCLWVARLDDEEIDIDAYRGVVDRMADEIKVGLPAEADETARLAALGKFFFEESGFHGNRRNYYQRANSHINEVLDDREGLPITLSVIYMELARRLDLHVEGVGLPGHFVVRYRPAAGEARLIDVYDGGQEISTKEAEERVLEATKTPLTEEQQRAMTKRAIVVRILSNLF
jgi:serine protease Do